MLNHVYSNHHSDPQKLIVCVKPSWILLCEQRVCNIPLLCTDRDIHLRSFLSSIPSLSSLFPLPLSPFPLSLSLKLPLFSSPLLLFYSFPLSFPFSSPLLLSSSFLSSSSFLPQVISQELSSFTMRQSRGTLMMQFSIATEPLASRNFLNSLWP